MCWDRDGGAAYRAVVSFSDDRAVSWDALEGIQPNLTPDEWYECDDVLRHDPRLVDALAKRGITDIEKVLIDVWGYRGFLLPDRWPGRRLGWTDIWFRSEPGSNPYANPVNGLHCVVDLNTMELLEIEDTFEVDRPQIMGEYVPRFVPDMRLRDDLREVEITQPRRGVVHGGRARAGVAELDAAAGLQPPRRAGPARARVRRPPSRAPDLAGRDGRAVPRSVARPLPPDRVRHRRVGPRLHDAVAGAGLRLPGRDHIRRRGAPRHRGRAVHDQERRLHPRGGRRRPVEARRSPPGRRGPALTAARRLRPRHGRQLRVPRLLAALPGRLDRVPRARDRDHGRRALARGRAGAARDDGRSPHVRAVPPALPDRAARHGRGRLGQHRPDGRVRSGGLRRRRSVRARADPARGAAADRVRGQAGLPLGDAAGLEDRESRVLSTTSARRSRTSSSRAPRSRTCSRRTRRCCGRPKRCATRCG